MRRGSYGGLGKAGWQAVHNALAAGPAPVPTVKAYEDSLTAEQLAVIKQLADATAAAAGPAPATTTGPSAAAQASTDSTTTTSGAKEPLATFENAHQMVTPVGQFGLDPAEWRAYQAQAASVSSDSTTTTNGVEMPFFLRRLVVE